jgi:hypothetical protein
MKTKIGLFIAISVIWVMNVVAQSNGYSIMAESRASEPFHYIIIKGEMNVKIIRSETPSVYVIGTQYQLGNTITMLRDDTLFIYQTNIRQRDSKTYVAIYTDGITQLEASGKTKVAFSRLVNQEHLTVSAKDGAQIRLNGRARRSGVPALSYNMP